jgi:high-affinity iron transporter
MLVNSVVIVLREVLEAALLISVLLAQSRRMQLRARWLLPALALGVSGAIAYAMLLGPVTELFDGVGQELTNALLQLGIFAGLVATVFLVARHSPRTNESQGILTACMAVTVALAISREGSEIFIFVSGFLVMKEMLLSVALGSLAGAGIGCSVGVLLYYLLLAMPERRATLTSLALLGLAASSMCSQATKLLIQADWLTVSGPLWDSSGVVPEQSVLGQLLYALIGYEASPTAQEVAAYAGSMAIIVISALLGRLLFKRERGGTS